MFSRQIFGRGARSIVARRAMCSKGSESKPAPNPNKEKMLYALLVVSCIVTSFPILVPESYFIKADHGHEEEEEEEEEEEDSEEVKADDATEEVEEAVAEEVAEEVKAEDNESAAEEDTSDEK
jgi:hypothetical protein